MIFCIADIRQKFFSVDCWWLVAVLPSATLFPPVYANWLGEHASVFSGCRQGLSELRCWCLKTSELTFSSEFVRKVHAKTRRGPLKEPFYVNPNVCLNWRP
jgi:hypothetical protein